MKSVLFKPKTPPCPPIKGSSPKKRKKKLDVGDKEEAKKKKKSIVKTSSSLLPVKTPEAPYLLPPLDISVTTPTNVSNVGLHGLLATGSISTTIPVTQLQSESLTVSVVGNNVITTEAKIGYPKIGQKRATTKGTKKTKISKKSTSQKNVTSVSNAHKYTASLGSQRSGNLSGHRFSSAGYNFNKANPQQQVTLQRVPTGSFVLSGATGHVRLQGGTNIVYLQQATSGSTQLIQTPLIANSSGTFTAVLSSSVVGTSVSPVSNAAKNNSIFLQQAKFLANSLQTITTSNIGSSASVSAMNVSSSTTCTTSSSSEAETASNLLMQAMGESTDAMNIPVGVAAAKDYNVQTTDISETSSAPLPSPSIFSTIQSLSNVSTSTIMTHLSANDLRYLASLIAKHSASRPNSPLQSPTATTSVTYKTIPVCSTATKPSSKTSPDVPARISIGTLSNTNEEKNTVVSKFNHVSASDKSISVLPNNQGVRKITYPSSLAQKVAAAQQKDTPMKTARLKTPRVVTSSISVSRNNVTSNNSKMPFTSKGLHKVPVTLTIPISSLPPNLTINTSSTLSKPLSVPALSAYLAQQKFVLSTTKSGMIQCGRAVLVSPDSMKKNSTMPNSLLAGNNSPRIGNISVFASNKMLTPAHVKAHLAAKNQTKNPSLMTSRKSAISGKTSATITLHLPTQSVVKDPNAIKKAASDIKLVGMLSPHVKTSISSPVNFSSLRSGSLPASPVRSPVGKSEEIIFPDGMSPEEFSPIEPRQSEESGEKEDLKDSEEQPKPKLYSPLKSSILAAMGENIKPLTPPSMPTSHSLLSHLGAVSASERNHEDGINKLSSMTKIGKMFVSPKATVEALKGNTSLSKLMISTSNAASTHRNGDRVTNFDESDVDFAVTTSVVKTSTYAMNKPVVIDTSKRVVDVSKLLHSSTTESSRVNEPNLKNLIVLTKERIQESKLKADTNKSVFPKLITPTLKGSFDVKSTPEGNVGSIVSADSKLRFEPLKVSNNRSKLTSVLSSMRETGKIILDENGKMRTTIVAKPTMVNSKTAALIAKTAFMNEHKGAILPASRIIVPQGVMPVTQGAKSTEVISSKVVSIVKTSSIPETNDRTMKNKCTSVTVKPTSDFVRISTQVPSGDISQTSNVANIRKVPVVPEFIADASVAGIEKKFIKNHVRKTKPSDEIKNVNEVVEKKEAPPPYVTRSGRVLRSRYPYADEGDKKLSVKKRRRTTSLNREDIQPVSKEARLTASTSETSQLTTLESLVEAAKLITKDEDVFNNGKCIKPTNTEEEQIFSASTSNNVLTGVDPTTSIAANAMLELLTSESKKSTEEESVQHVDSTNIKKECSSVVSTSMEINSKTIPVTPLAPDINVPIADNVSSDNQKGIDSSKTSNSQQELVVEE